MSRTRRRSLHSQFLAGVLARSIARPVRQVARGVENATSGAGTLRVLAVDDEPATLRLATLLLTGEGHVVTSAPSGEVALECLREQRYDLVISDLGLGDGMNGWDLIERVGAEWPDTGCILATGWGAGIDQQEAAERGADAVLAKPYRVADLRAALERASARRASSAAQAPGRPLPPPPSPPRRRGGAA